MCLKDCDRDMYFGKQFNIRCYSAKSQAFHTIDGDLFVDELLITETEQEIQT